MVTAATDRPRRRFLTQKLRAMAYSQVEIDELPRKSPRLRATARSVSCRMSLASLGS